MGLFQNSVLKKHLKTLDDQIINQAWETFTKHFKDATIQENIRNSKEEQYQEGFLIDLFVKVLGYTKNPEPNFNLTTELKNIKGAKKTDGAILDNNQDAICVIELKGMNTPDLSKVEVQAFGYKNNQPKAVYVVTSNFEKLRFYIDKAIDFESFNLFQLTKDQFKLLWLCLAKDSLLKGVPKKIKDESLTKEESITNQLYKDYSSFKNELFNNLTEQNPNIDKLMLFKKTQKLLDRFLFIFFAEDKGLLPPNLIKEVIQKWTDLKEKHDEYYTLYNRFQKYFGYLNTGYTGKHYDIFAYNGGLFAEDKILDRVAVKDDILNNYTLKLAKYDFSTEVDVNILGHIFEHSLNENEKVTAKLEGKSFDSKISIRKKEGVFYTPKYIAKYIIESTVGKLCEEKKQALDIDEDEYQKERKGRKKVKLKELKQKLDHYREWLLKITICDPACGSGSLLNQALEFLIDEHTFIDELETILLGESIPFPNIEGAILENNLYGVDINEEAVEIAKLSLWLRTADYKRKLTTLSSNLKVGNSLVDDPHIDKKAFNWQKEFPEVFNKGGFDVVVGNPPYLRVQGLRENFEKETAFYEKKYESATGRFDKYVLFIERSYQLINPEGVISMILPHKFLVRTVYEINA